MSRLIIDELFNMKLNDGSRHFMDMPEVVFFDEIADHVEDLEGAEITEFLTDGILQMWLEFEFRENRFSVTNQLGDYRFFVQNPNCPDEILLEAAAHFRRLLEK